MNSNFLKVAVVIGALLHGAAAMAIPTIFNASPTVNNSNTLGDVIFIQGDGFGTTTQVEYSYNSNTWVALQPLTEGNNTVTVRMPGGITTGANPTPANLITVRVSADGSTWSAPAFINRAHAMHFDTSLVAPGSSFRIFGRNLYLGSAVPTVRLVDQSTGISYAATVEPISGNPYILPVTAPDGITAGDTFSVYVSNGLNGSSAFGTGETVADQTFTGSSAGTDVWSLGVAWAGDFAGFYNNVYNVQTDSRLVFHAAGNGVNNDQPAIQNAINIANAAGGGVVYLPAGTYVLNFNPNTVAGGISLLSNVVLEGAGINATIIRYGYGTPSAASEGYGLCEANNWNSISKSGVANLSLVNVNSSWMQNVRWATYNLSTELFMKNVGIYQNSGNAMSFGDVSDVALEGCIFQALGGTGSDLLLGTPTNYVFRGNTFQWSAGQAVNIASAVNGVIEGNAFIRNCNFALYPQNGNTRCFDIPNITDLAILNNTFGVTGGVANDTYNDGETILQERAGGTVGNACTGTVTSASQTTISDTTKSWTSSSFAPGAVVAIVWGTGAGQWSTITSITSTQITVSPAWVVAPAAGSSYAVFRWNGQNILIQGNSMSNNRAGIEFSKCPEINVAIVNNTLTNNNGILFEAYQNNSAPATQDEFTPIWNSQIVGNTIVDTNGAEPASIGLIFDQINSPVTLGAAGLGVEMRNNKVSGLSPAAFPISSSLPNTEGYYNYAGYEMTPPTNPSVAGIVGTVLQGNTASNCGRAYSLCSGDYESSVVDTIESNDTQMIFDTQIDASLHPSIDTAVDYQAEDGVVAGGAIVMTDTYASGGKDVGDMQVTGRSVTFNNVDGEAGSSHTLTIRYAWAVAAKSTLYVNGVSQGVVSFPKTNGYSGPGCWSTVSVPITLLPGTNNTIMLKTAGGNGGIQLDKITVH